MTLSQLSSPTEEDHSMTTTPADYDQGLFVLVWRETDSPRLRTWVDEGNFKPLALKMKDINPPPTLVISDKESLDQYLQGSEIEMTAAVLSSLIEEELGWETSARPDSAPESIPPTDPAPTE